MSEIQYMVGQIPITIALQVMRQLAAAQVPAQLTPTDQDTAAIEVALFDRPTLDDLLAPIERAAIDTRLPFPDLHAAILAGSYAPNSGDKDHDDFTFWLIRYALHAGQSDALDDLADACDRRIARADLRLDLIAAYGALARLARWRAEQLRGAK